MLVHCSERGFSVEKAPTMLSVHVPQIETSTMLSLLFAILPEVE